MGRIAYEQSGETFFLPFGLEDIEPSGQKMEPDDQVEFYISTDEKWVEHLTSVKWLNVLKFTQLLTCLLYTSDAADE